MSKAMSGQGIMSKAKWNLKFLMYVQYLPSATRPSDIDDNIYKNI